MTFKIADPLACLKSGSLIVGGFRSSCSVVSPARKNSCRMRRDFSSHRYFSDSSGNPNPAWLSPNGR